MSYGAPSPFGQPQYTQRPATNNNTVKILLIVGGVAMFVMLLCGGVMVALLVPAIGAARQAAARMQTGNNMKVIGLALHNYHADYHSLPPAYLTDASGNPTLSWRVLLLPYMNEKPLYDQFDLSQAWNSPANAALTSRRPSTFAKPNDDKLPADHTTFVAVRSPQSILADSTPISFAQVIDGLANTLAIVDHSAKSVVWTAPDDTSPDEFYAAFKQSSAPVLVLCCDGAVRAVSSGETSETNLRAYITRNGREPVPDL